jgi:hypothetical protein
MVNINERARSFGLVGGCSDPSNALFEMKYIEVSRFGGKAFYLYIAFLDFTWKRPFTSSLLLPFALPLASFLLSIPLRALLIESLMDIVI